VVLGTHVDLSALALAAGGSVNVFASLVGADERDSFYVRVRADLRDRVATALHHVDDAIRDARLLQQINQQLCCACHPL